MMKIDEREIAVDILIEILEEDGYNNIVLRNALKRFPDLTSTQKRFITELVNGTLRNIIYLDYIVDSVSDTKTAKMKSLILCIIRISVYQICFMDKVPKSAICNSAVNIAKKRGLTGLSGFVNGVIRGIMRSIDTIEFPTEDNHVEFLSIMYSYPKWIIKYWINIYPFEVVKNMCIENNKPPKMSACLNTELASKKDIILCLQSEGVNVVEDGLYDNLIYLSNTSNILNLTAFQKGYFHVMDKSSMLSINILDPQSEENILDLCAAPGGKSFYTSHKMKNTGSILSCDIHPHKIELMETSISRLGIKNITTKINDGCKVNFDFVDKFDKVILDAPCSCLGLIKKKPDIKYSKTFADIQELIKLQRELLTVSSQYVKIGGKLIYSTCTVSQKENIGNINWFIENFDFQLEETHQLIPGNDNVTSDGFFIALLKRKG